MLRSSLTVVLQAAMPQTARRTRRRRAVGSQGAMVPPRSLRSVAAARHDRAALSLIGFGPGPRLRNPGQEEVRVGRLDEHFRNDAQRGAEPLEPLAGRGLASVLVHDRLELEERAEPLHPIEVNTDPLVDVDLALLPHHDPRLQGGREDLEEALPLAARGEEVLAWPRRGLVGPLVRDELGGLLPAAPGCRAGSRGIGPPPPPELEAAARGPEVRVFLPLAGVERR